MEAKKIRFIDGFSESAWKSLAVKSLRIGWAQGLIEASERLSKSTMQSLLVAGIFEDLFPTSLVELDEMYFNIVNKNYFHLCEYDTHHGRGLSNEFCDYEKEATEKGRAYAGGIVANYISPYTSLKWVNPRVGNCLYTWWKIKPHDHGRKRALLDMEFTGMPDCVLDGHTYEGKRKKRDCLLLSGHYYNHRKIGEIVTKNGWEAIREKFKNDKMHPVKMDLKQGVLF